MGLMGVTKLIDEINLCLLDRGWKTCHDCERRATRKYWKPIEGGKVPKPATLFLCKRHYNERLQRSADQICGMLAFHGVK